MRESEVRQRLAEYAAGTLPAGPRGAVAAHLAGCGACRTELAGWHAMAGGHEQPPGPEIVRDPLLGSVLSPADPLVATGRRWRHPLRLLRAQARVIPAVVWAASAAVIVGSVMLAWRAAAGSAGLVLAVVAPIVAALTIAGTCGHDRDMAVEICAATPTSPRLVVLARLTLVLGGDVALALTASAVLWLLRVPDGDLVALIGAWLGPVALLSGLALLAAVLVGAEVAAGVATAVWLARLVAGGWLGVPAAWLAPLQAIWTTNPGTVAAAALLLATAGLLAGRREPVLRRRATS